MWKESNGRNRIGWYETKRGKVDAARCTPTIINTSIIVDKNTSIIFHCQENIFGAMDNGTNNNVRLFLKIIKKKKSIFSRISIVEY